MQFVFCLLEKGKGVACAAETQGARKWGKRGQMTPLENTHGADDGDETLPNKERDSACDVSLGTITLVVNAAEPDKVKERPEGGTKTNKEDDERRDVHVHCVRLEDQHKAKQRREQNLHSTLDAPPIAAAGDCVEIGNVRTRVNNVRAEHNDNADEKKNLLEARDSARRRAALRLLLLRV